MASRLKLGFKWLGSRKDNLESIYIKYHDVYKRKFVWTVWEKDRGNYVDYGDFKKSWDSNMSVWEEIKKSTKLNIKGDAERLLLDKDPFGTRNKLNNKGVLHGLSIKDNTKNSKHSYKEKPNLKSVTTDSKVKRELYTKSLVGKHYPKENSVLYG